MSAPLHRKGQVISQVNDDRRVDSTAPQRNDLQSAEATNGQG